MPAEVLAGIEGEPWWPPLAALVHTPPYDLALTGDGGVPVDRFATITVPTLLLGGAESPLWFQGAVAAIAAAVPDARCQLVDGQTHEVAPRGARAGARCQSRFLTAFGAGRLAPPGPVCFPLLSTI